MKTTLKIAKLELSLLFYSPIAWFLSVVFIFQCALLYTSQLETYLDYQNIGGGMLNNLHNLTSAIFGIRTGLYGDVLKKIYLYLPLLTMGLISREISSGTIKLLYSSPVKIRQIVLGKFTSLMIYNLLLIAILVIFVISATFNIKQADTGLLLAGLLTVYLLLCAYAAIGLFMSCLTAYQIVAAISTLVVFAVLANIGNVWQDTEAFRTLSYCLSMNGRAEKIIYGLINTKDIAYFIIIIFLFLAFSIVKLHAARETKSASLKIAGRYVLVILISFTAGYITSLPSLIGYYDPTVNRSQTLTPTTQKVLKDIGNAPLEIISYINLLDQRFGQGVPRYRNYEKERWEPYLRFKPNITFKYVYYYDEPSADHMLHKYYPDKTLKQIAEQNAKPFNLDLKDVKSPKEIKKIINLQPERNRYVMQLSYKGRKTFLRLFDDQAQFPSETEVSAALKRLTVKLPKVLFAQSEFERSIIKLSDRDYGLIVSQITNRNAMVNQGFDTDSIDLNTQDIPAGISALVIADPKVAFKPAVLAKINQYIDKGGNLLVTTEPGKQAVINPVINPLGVSLMNGIIVQKSKDFSPDVVKAELTEKTAGFSLDLKGNFNSQIKLNMPGVTGLTYRQNGDYKIEPLFVTDPKTSWLRADKFIPDSIEVVFSAEKGDRKISVPTALALTRQINGKEQRIVIAGDADFLNSTETMGWYSANRNFYMPLMGWFTYGQFPIDTSRPRSEDDRLNLTDSGLMTLKIIYLGVLPGLIILCGAGLLIRRKRK
ncbi:Gldg family protein [Pedobacter rhodius]|uniref:Gldg family protein n=1 Tax=Pedobacter rhodius TaxID=3004098 RepID=A0ABT4KUB6_9SPHI|nr:Gldg family protein [Pedobacter sp. SJ11]MCZ4222529.1 Gldg family protein [Pedobacter sp. SJ11]